MPAVTIWPDRRGGRTVRHPTADPSPARQCDDSVATVASRPFPTGSPNAVIRENAPMTAHNRTLLAKLAPMFGAQQRWAKSPRCGPRQQGKRASGRIGQVGGDEDGRGREGLGHWPA